jgi:hypothetical protein
MIKHTDSHLDHALTEAQVEHLLATFAERAEFFIATIELPLDLGTVPCGLWGPAMGDEPVSPAEVHYAPRGTRAYSSRLCDRPARPTRTVTVIAGPHDGHPCVLFTAFGGPPTPQEPDDPECKDPIASRQFWVQHALSK